jgi:hypothetical protein
VKQINKLSGTILWKQITGSEAETSREAKHNRSLFMELTAIKDKGKFVPVLK